MISEFAKSRTNAQGVNFSILLYHYHVLFGFYYGWFAQGTDTTFYWNLGDRFRQFEFETWFSTYGTHNNFVFFLNYPFSKVLGLDFWTGTFLYASVSAWAFILIYMVGEELFKVEPIKLYGFKIWPLILLLPSLHFWSSGIGKDALVFLFISMFFYGLRDLRKHVFLVGLSLILLYHVRPHMAFIVFLSTAFMLVLDSKLHSSYKLIFFSLSLVGFFLIYGQVLEFLKIDEINTENIEAVFNKSSTNLSYGRSFVDMSSYPYPLKVFTFLFRPLFFDAHNFTSFLNSFENLIYLILAGTVLKKVNPIKAYQKSPVHLKILLITFLLASIAFAGSLSNFGIMVRMKNMTFVYFLIFLIYIYQVHLLERREYIIRKITEAQKRKAVLARKVGG
ncbi:hypothetical protein B879_02664 [Cecembia lonarensis LW9]|uniref:Uncharacterized protein n=2 Tax=Cecembia TaxID=1187078 RepID=K1KX86_CECL9|nr:hypothetical protein B879_02664 [Cecembia lonarensis LW9]